MSINNPEVQRRALLYAKSVGISMADLRPFDGGDDGDVWYSDSRTILKSFQSAENYTHERECYRRLCDAGFGKKVCDFNVPEFLGSSDELCVIEITPVFPPYILDFGKAYLSDPNFPEHVMRDWHSRMRFWWGEHLPAVRRALAALRGCGIWYFDAKPGNIMVKDWNPSLDDDKEDFE